MKRLQPKLSEFRRVYSSPEFSRRVLDKWNPGTRIRIDLSAIKNAIVQEVEIEERERRGRGRERRRVVFKEFKGDWKREGEGEGEERFADWEPIRALKLRLREFEVKRSSEEIFGVLKSSEFVEKVKSSLVRSAFCFSI